MKIVLAPDSFKESMTAAEAAAAMARGVRQVEPDATCVEVPMADGGEGTTDALVSALGGTFVGVPVRDALGRPRMGRIGLVRDVPHAGDSGEGNGRLGVVEVAAAVGLDMIEPSERDPLAASSTGVADLVRAALDAGADRLVVGLGGSATNDGGAGLLVGLGARLLDGDGQEVDPSASSLGRIARIDLSGLDPRVQEIGIDLACDVTNPLLGEHGASAVFGPQKGADPEQVEELDHNLSVLVDALETACGFPVRDLEGAGAAGGLGAAFLALGGRRRRGVDVVIEAVGLRQAMDGADLVLTGEGSIDAQTLSGKTPAGVAEVAADLDIPTIAFAGRVDPDADVLLDHGFTAVVPITAGPGELSALLKEGTRNLERAVATALRLIRLGSGAGTRLH